MKRYNPSDIELKWQKKWAESGVYFAKDFSDKPKFVMLTEFPYPSGVGLHMGHLREYTLGDIIARHKRATGYNVLFPMGFDCFGLPTENYAIKNKISPQVATEENTANFRKQLNMMGYSIDWNRSFNTSDPEYYRWTQWMFLQFYKAGLAYQDEIAINWCPFCKTGLANEEVVNGRHERCDNPVEKRKLKQWMLRITDYADKLIDGLSTVDYPSRIADQQINWIGRSEGAEIEFAVDEKEEKIKVFTTRPDTIFGATFMALAPEHPLIEKIVTEEQRPKVNQYIEQSAQFTDVERQENKEKTGVFTGSFAINPANGEKIPIWVADYILSSYGDGAIMAVPAHDERDFAFADKFGIPIIPVIEQITGEKRENESHKDSVVAVVYDPKEKKYLTINWGSKGGRLFVGGTRHDDEDPVDCAKREIAEETGYTDLEYVNSISPINHHYYAFNKDKAYEIDAIGLLFNLTSDEKSDRKLDEEEIDNFKVEWVSKGVIDNEVKDELHKTVFENLNNPAIYTGVGKMINSNQFDGKNSADASKEILQWLEEKGVAKPKVNYKLRDWVYSRQHYWGEPIPIVYCDKCGVVPVPEDQLPVELPTVDHYEPTDDGKSPLSLIESFVNTTCPKCGGKAKRETDTMPNWAGSNWYYLRYYDAHNNKEFADKEKLEYWNMVDLYLGGMEHTTLHLLYSRFHHQFLHDQGLVPTEEPYASRRGQGIILAADGRKMSKSLGNVVDPTQIIENGYGADAARLTVTFLAPYDQTTAWSPEAVAGCYRFLGRVWNMAQEVVEKDGKSNTDALRVIHTAIKKVSTDLEKMNFNTAIAGMMEAINDLNKVGIENISKSDFSKLVQVLSPFAPHISAELYEQLGNTELLDNVEWPKFDEKYLAQDEIVLAVQVNGKLRGEATIKKNASESEVKEEALKLENVQSFINDKEIKKTIYVPNRIINFVV